MHPYLNIFGRQIPTYGVLGVLGFVLGLLYILCQKRKDKETLIYIFVFGLLGAVGGSWLLYLIISHKPGGMVFYGGLGGMILVGSLAARFFRMPIPEVIPVMVPAGCLFHMCGRVGCYFAGCCYGRDGIPVQLIEAGYVLLIFLLLQIIIRRTKIDPLIFYLSLYAPGRFILEFFRGDEVRGFFLGVSTSQWISILIIAFLLIRILIRSGKKKKNQSFQIQG